jgi:hypothetical protein
MRQVFTSVRLENVESVEKVLNDAGIETRISQGRTWKGSSRREFSYTAKNHDVSQQPALWVIKPDDFKQAREILHDAGLLESTRDASFLPDHLQFEQRAVASPMSRMAKFRLVLLAIVMILVGSLMMKAWLS